MKKFSILLMLIFTLVGVATAETKKVATPAPNSKSSAGEILESREIYYLQHKLIPKWVFESKGAFFSYLQSGNVDRFITLASDIVSPDYAKEIKVTRIENREAVLITFPLPKNISECYFAIVEKSGDKFNYYTYEKTLSFGDSVFKGVLGGWSEGGSHSNYGQRAYETSAEFIKDVFSKK